MVRRRGKACTHAAADGNVESGGSTGSRAKWFSELVTGYPNAVDTVSSSVFFFFSSRRRHTRCSRDWSSDVCSSDLTPYCSPTDTAIENASMIPDRVDPCFEALRKISPRPLSGYEPAVTYPSASPTRNDVVSAGRDCGSRFLADQARTAGSAPGASSVFFLYPAFCSDSLPMVALCATA